MQSRRLSFAPALVLSLLGVSSFAQTQVTTVPTSLNFQGRLATPNGTPVADGTYSVRFSLWDAVSAGTEKWNKTVANVAVKNGVFAVTLDTFPANTFNGNLWIEIKIGSDTALAPRTPLVSVPYAMKSDIALTVPDGSLTASKFAAGELNSAVNGLAWLLGGNSSTNPASHFLGTTDGQPLAFRTNNAERLRIDPFGRVGIGTNTPTVMLDVAGDIQTTSLLFLRRNDPNSFISYLPQGGTGAHEWWVGANRSDSGIAPAGSFSFFDNTAGATRLSLNDSGNVGIGTSDPQAKLHVSGTMRIEANNMLELGGGITKQTDAGKIGYQVYSDALDIIGAGTDGGNRKVKLWAEGGVTFTGGAIFTGNVGVGTATPGAKLDVNGTARMSGFQMVAGAGANKVLTSDASGNGTWAQFAASGWQLGGNSGTNPASQFVGTTDAQPVAFRTNNTERIRINANGNVGIGTASPSTLLHVNGEITASVVTILGGSDVAEPYHVASAGEVKPRPGMVVSIDPDQIGQMRVASRAYDTTVAGIISGANGISPGITLRQKGTIADGEYPVASIGRVWVLCDTDANGSIAPGDLLTTSDTPGHAMRATDRERRDGAIIGKAMSPLKSGRGMVLVLVSLK